MNIIARILAILFAIFSFAILIFVIVPLGAFFIAIFVILIILVLAITILKYIIRKAKQAVGIKTANNSTIYVRVTPAGNVAAQNAQRKSHNVIDTDAKEVK